MVYGNKNKLIEVVLLQRKVNCFKRVACTVISFQFYVIELSYPSLLLTTTVRK